MGLITIEIEKAYLKNHSYFYDPVYYSFYNARLYARLADEGRLSLAVQEWFSNGRHPLRTVPLLLFAPGLLAHPMGHMVTALPVFLVFLLLLGWTIRHRTGSTPYALGCMLLFCTIPGLFSPTTGLGAYWLDLVAALLVGGSVLCLLNSHGARDLRWLAGFALLASLAALSRYVGAAYTFVICAPVLAYYLIRRWRQEGSVVKPVLLPLGVIGTVIGVVAGYFLVAHFEGNSQFYSVYGYALGHGVLSSAVFVTRAVRDVFSTTGIIGLGVIGLINLALFRRDMSRDWRSSLISIWLASAVILYLVLVLRVVGNGITTLYGVTLIFLAVVSPSHLSQQRSDNRRLALLTGVVIAVAFLVGGPAVLKNYQLATTPSADARNQKALDVALAQALSGEDDILVWNAYFDEYAWIPTMEAFYRSGKLYVPAGQPFFNAHESAWLGDYPDMTPGEVSERVYAGTSKWVDLAVVFDEPTRADTNTWMTNPYSRSVARYVAERIRNDANWSRVFVVDSQRYGSLAGYRNLSSQGRGYGLALRSSSQVRP